MDLFDKIEQKMKSDLGQYAAVGHGYFSFPKLEGEIGPRMRWRGKEVIVWSINSYLGLANHPEVRKVDAEAAAKWGLAYPMGSRLMSGHTSLHEEFEKQAAEFMGKEDAFLLNFGYQGMLSIITALADRKDVIVYDQLSHACIIDGMNTSPAKRFVYAHNNMEQLENRLQRAMRVIEKTGGGILVITEGVFGMHGDMGALDKIVALKKKYPFRLLVDDAHGFGVMGKNGRGAGEELGVLDEIDVYFTTFAKSMASIGAFVAGKKFLIDFFRYNMRSQVFAKSLPMPLVEGAIKRLELLRTRPELREHLWKVVRTLQNGLRELGFNLGRTQSPVTPVFLSGKPNEAMNIISDLRENYNIFVSGVTYPVVEKGVILIRIIPTAAHSLEDVEITLNAFKEASEKLKKGEYDKPFSLSVTH